MAFRGCDEGRGWKASSPCDYRPAGVDGVIQSSLQEQQVRRRMHGIPNTFRAMAHFHWSRDTPVGD